jgi:arsenate reductase
MSTAATRPEPPAGTVVWQYPKCSTCRKTLKWLDEHGVKRQSIDLVQSPPSPSQLRDLWKRSELPLAKMFNTSGESYRAGGFKEKLARMSESEALAALAADGKLIKRPLIDTGDAVLVGHDETRLAATFGSRPRRG